MLCKYKNMKETNKILDPRIKLQALWITVMVLMIFADIFTIMVELVYKNTLGDMPGEVRMVMAFAAVATLISTSMIYLSRVLPRKSNRIVNIVAGILTVIYIVGGGSVTPHYLIAGGAELVALTAIIVQSWRWTSV